MALSPDHIRQDYPLPVYNYRVTIGDQEVSFTEVSGLMVEYETVVYKHGLSFLEGEGYIKYRYDKWYTITMKKGVARNQQFLYQWMKSVEAKKNILVSLMDEKGTPVIQWKIGTAVPVKLEAPTFDVNSNDVAIETLELSIAHITLEYF